MLTEEVLVHDGRPWTRMSRKVNGSISFKGPTERVLSLFLPEEPALTCEFIFWPEVTPETAVLSSAKLSCLDRTQHNLMVHCDFTQGKLICQYTSELYYSARKGAQSTCMHRKETNYQSCSERKHLHSCVVL